ncbi:MAG: hypothetical protein IKE89_05600 [Bacilli bacterium]|nr:hypothetical protein [Bacilli bacterium]
MNDSTQLMIIKEKLDGLKNELNEYKQLTLDNLQIDKKIFNEDNIEVLKSNVSKLENILNQMINNNSEE